MLKSEEKTKNQRKAEEQVIKDTLFETFFVQQDLQQSYGYLNQLCQASVHSLAVEESSLSPHAVEFLLDLKETVMSLAIMTGETQGITAFDHQNVLRRFMENMKQIEKDQKE
jgi:hypothetical protein